MSQVSRVGERWELSLDSRQIFFVLFGTAAVASLLFLVGVLIGKRIEARAGSLGHCAPSLEDLDKISDKNLKFTFHEVLVHKGQNPDLPPEVQETADIDEPDQRATGNSSRTGSRARTTERNGKGTNMSPGPARMGQVMKSATQTGLRARRSRRRFTLQVGSFRSRKEAETMVRNLKAKGLAPSIVTSYLKGRGMWYRVRVGAFGSWKRSLAAKKDFEKQWHMTAYVTRLR